MSSSPKITLELYPRPSNVDLHALSNQDAISGVSGLDKTLGALSLKSQPSWVCKICYHSNEGSLIKCAVCGVKKPARDENTHVVKAPVSDSFLLNAPKDLSSHPHNKAGGGDDAAPGIACPACTFHNDPFMIQCEICQTELQDPQSIAFMLDRQEQHQRSIRQLPSTIDVGSSSSSSIPSAMNGSASNLPASDVSTGKGLGAGKFLTSVTSLYSGSVTKSSEDANSVKLSFRGGGSGAFHTLLKAAMSAKAWESIPKQQPEDRTMALALNSNAAPTPVIKVGGISGIMRSVETNQKATDETLSQAFQDLEALIDKAAEMVTLAENISKGLAKSNTMNNEETATFKAYLLSMGIAAPVTKDTAGVVFHKELARELFEFILPVVEREGGTMSLMDVYCVFNRARGVELISPKDLHTACQLFPELNLPLRLRKFDSGLLVLQTLSRYSNDEVSESILSRIKNLPPGSSLDAIELASAVQISVVLAQEQLLMTEARGLICRDESVNGLRFYDNLLDKWEI
ncbi:Vacuolar protein-sorting-associated protein 36 [Lobosporangium transversale]|nr:Vacuolar protein-sorting-associated protein 36 [Lobosporangium transversale]